VGGAGVADRSHGRWPQTRGHSSPRDAGYKESIYKTPAPGVFFPGGSLAEPGRASHQPILLPGANHAVTVAIPSIGRGAPPLDRHPSRGFRRPGVEEVGHALALASSFPLSLAARRPRGSCYLLQGVPEHSALQAETRSAWP